MTEACLSLSPANIDDYRKFLAIKRMPKFRFCGERAYFPSEYAAELGIIVPSKAKLKYTPLPGLFDYQRDIARMAIEKEKFAVFADCGLGKTLIMTEFARHAAKHIDAGRCILIVSPLMVIRQTLGEINRFYGASLPVEQVRAAGLREWLANGKGRIGITNYDALEADIDGGRLGGLILDESSMMKSAYGKWAQTILKLGKGLRWKLAGTGTPAPNDRIEYANHAVFLDQFPTVNAFLARYFINRGQTDNRWELKPHAMEAFYRSLAHWGIFLTNPATYGWKDNCGTIPPIHIHIHEVGLTARQQELVYEKTGTLFAHEAGGITSRSVLSQIAKGHHKGESIPTFKTQYIRELVQSWPDESTIIWCKYNAEQEILENEMPQAASIKGSTGEDERLRAIEDFQCGRKLMLISKAKLLGFGLNLQIATRHVFSGLQDSYEEFYQCIKRSNRVRSIRPLNVHIPITAIERPMINTVLEKAKRVQDDAAEQERIFNAARLK